jgi:GDP-4-dehydro-6-deoxy-D-mannose reductase
MSKQVLVTGANGFVGRHVVRDLANHGYAVVAVGGRSGGGEPEGASEYTTVDLSDYADVEAKLDFTNVVGVIHLAGLASVGASFDNPEKYLKANPGFQENLFKRAAAQQASPRFVIISSGSVYGADAVKHLPVKEDSSVKADSPYAESKLLQEKSALESNFGCIIARPFNHIGPGQEPGFLVPDLASQLVKFEKGEADNILVGNLEAKRDYSDVRDIAAAYRLLFEHGKAGETYNICTGVSHSGQEVLDSLLALLQEKPLVIQDQTRMRPSDKPDIYGDSSKLRNDTGWTPKYTLEQSLHDALDDWRSR